MTSYAPDCMSGKLIFNQVHYAMILTRIIVSDIAVFVPKRDVKLQPTNHLDKNYSNCDTSVQVTVQLQAQRMHNVDVLPLRVSHGDRTTALLVHIRVNVMVLYLIAIVAVSDQSQARRRRRQSLVDVDLVRRGTDRVSVRRHDRASAAHVLHPVSAVTELVTGRRHAEAAAVEGVAEQVPVGRLVVAAGLLVVRMVVVMTVDRRLRHELMRRRLLVLVDPVRIEVMRRRTGRRVLVLVLELGRLRDAVRRREIGRLVVDSGSDRRIIVEPQSSRCVGHRVNVRRRHEAVRRRTVMQQIQTTAVQVLQRHSDITTP